MKKNTKKIIWITLLTLLCVALAAGLTFAKFAGSWGHEFGLSIFPVQQDETDHTLRRYFRSNELLPASENASYAVNGTSAWFTVANALDSKTVSEDNVAYSLTWYVSVDGSTWNQYKTESGSFEKDVYKVDKFYVQPVTLEGITYNHIKVVGDTSSFLQEKIEASYSFTYSSYASSISYADGVITIHLDTNDVEGDFEFTWTAGITPDNSDPTGMLENAKVGPDNITLNLGKNTDYEFLFFVTGEAALANLDASPDTAYQYVSFIRK